MASLSDDHLHYPLRRRGMDHDRYDWTIMPRRARIEWPGEARVAVWIVVSLQWFPLTLTKHPRPPLGAFDDPWPNFRDYTHRDYGNRVGAFRIIELMHRYGLRVTSPVNASVCERYPPLIAEALRHGWEFMGHGVNMGRFHDANLAAHEEAEMVQTALATVRRATGQKVAGWLSPALAESSQTLDHLAANGVEYVCDWVNDELPYPMRTQSGSIWSMPYSLDINDATMIWHYHHSPNEFAQQAREQFDWLYAEAERQGGRIFPLALHPWCTGQPHRIRALESIVAHIASRPGVWTAGGSEILAAFKAQSA